MKQGWLLRFRKSPPHTQTNIVCTALITIATIAYAATAGRQLILINRQIAIMQGALDEAKRSGEQSTEQMWSAVGNINWMARSMDSSQKQSQVSLQASIENFHLEQRAWLGLASVEMKPMKAPDPIRATMVVLNSGKTPALHAAFNFFMHPSDVPINAAEYVKHPIEPQSPPHTASMVLPGAVKLLPSSTGSTDEFEVQSVQNGRKLIYFFAFMSYRDVFRVEHHTRVCALLDFKGGGFSSCPGDFDQAD